MLLIPSIAYNERVNSILGIIRNQRRKSLNFESTRAAIITKMNADMIDI